MIEFYKKHGLLVYWFILMIDCYDTAVAQSDYGFYLKGLLYLSLVLLLALNFNKRHHTISKWLIFGALTANLAGSYLNLLGTTNMSFLGYALYGVANILFILFMYRLVRHEILTSKEPLIVGGIVLIGGIILIIKTKVDFEGFNYFAYAYGFVLCIMVVFSLKLLGIKNKRSTAINNFIPSSILMIVAAVIQVVFFNMHGEKNNGVFNTTEILCSGYAIALMVNGAKKVLK